MQGTWVWSLVREDSVCCRATTPMSHDFWACTLEVVNYKRSYFKEKPVHCNEEWLPSPHLLQPEKATVRQQRPSASKKRKNNFLNWFLTVLEAGSLGSGDQPAQVLVKELSSEWHTANFLLDPPMSEIASRRAFWVPFYVFISLVSNFNFSLFLNYESMITHLQET